MKPLNLDNKPCSPISSNCVVWQGPDIPCIELCTGDTVSDVVSQMATELCTILDTLKVSNYDLTCFNLQSCGPQDFQALIQFLIDKICENQGLTPAEKDAPTCPDCVVSVAECFVTGNQTTMQLVDYVQLIGERLCSIASEISLINTQITDILIRVTALEDADPPTFTIPSIAITCASFPLSGTQAIDDVLAEFINNVWCGFYAVTGTATELTNAINLNKCVDETTPTLTNPASNYGSISGWVASADYDTVADSISNMWILLCDLFTYLGAVPTLEVQDDGAVIESDTSVMNFTGAGVTVSSAFPNNVEVNIPGSSAIADTGWVDLEGFEFMTGSNAANRPQCRRIGSVIHFRGFVVVPLADGSNVPVEMDELDAYDFNTTITPATGNDGTFFGVSTNSNGSLNWNQGYRVIPTSVLDASETLDGTYNPPYPSVMTRDVEILRAGVRDGDGTQLNALGRLGIRPNGTLYFATLKDQERPSGLSNNLAGASPLRFIASKVRAGERVPNYIGDNAHIQSLPVYPTWDTNDAYSVGNIVTFNNDLYECFTNILAGTGAPDPSVTPGNWSPYKDKIETDKEFAEFGTGTIIDFTWQFSCDTGEEDQIGGFVMTIDGLTAFVDCDATPATADCNTP